MKKIKKKKGLKGLDGLTGLSGFANSIMALGIQTIAMTIVLQTIREAGEAEQRTHLLELKKMKATYIIIRTKKIKRININISDLQDFIKKFLKNHKNYKLEKNNIGKLDKDDKKEMFYYQLTRIYKPKPVKISKDCCSKCGRYFDDYD